MESIVAALHRGCLDFVFLISLKPELQLCVFGKTPPLVHYFHRKVMSKSNSIGRVHQFE